MKIILLFSLLLTSLLASQTQIVLGTYSKHASAISIQSQLDSIILKDNELKNILKNNNAKSVVKEIKKYYVVTIEPFNSYKIQNIVLDKIKKTKFKDAYILNIDTAKKIDKKIDKKIETKVETKVEKQIPKTKDPVPVVIAESNNESMLHKYFMEIVSFIIILTLFIIFILTRKSTKKKNIDVLNGNTQTEPIIEKEVVNKQNDNEPIVSENNNDLETIVKQEKPTIVPKKIKQFTGKKKADFEDFKDCRIMLAEDNMINQKVVIGLLSTSGIQIVVVDDGLEAINFLKDDNDFCIVLMDAHMPNMDGYEATRQIRQNEDYSHITVIALSGDTAADDVRKMKESGMKEHLEKPLKIDSLYSILSAYAFQRNGIVDLNENISINNEQELYSDVGIEICGGDEDFYKEILNDFIRDNSDTTSKIQSSLNTNDFVEADKLLVDISGIVANIGATNIKQILKEFRVSIKSPEDEKYIQIFVKYAKHYEALIQEVKEYLAK